MKSKEPINFISALRWAFSITLILTLFFLPFSFIYYSEISLDSKISSFFSFISTFGIAATIGVYFWQKNDSNKKQKDFDEKLIPLIKKKSQLILYTIKEIESLIKREGDNDTLLIKKDTLTLTRHTDIGSKSDYFDYFFSNSVELNTHNSDDNEINNNKLKLSSDLYHYIRRLNDEFNYIVSKLNSYIASNIHYKSSTGYILSICNNNQRIRNKNDLLNSIEILEWFIENQLEVM